MRIRMNQERERRLKQAMDELDEKTKAGAIDAALNHLLADRRNKERVADELESEIVEELSTPWVPMERETTVGK